MNDFCPQFFREGEALGERLRNDIIIGSFVVNSVAVVPKLMQAEDGE